MNMSLVAFIMMVIIMIVCMVTAVLIGVDTDKHIKEDDDVEEDISLGLRGFLIGLFSGLLVGTIILRGNKKLIEAEWNEVDRLKYKLNMGFVAGLVVRVPFEYLIVALMNLVI